MESCQLFDSWRQSLSIVVNTWKYKDGAFIGIISGSTPVIHAFDYMIDCPLVTNNEKVSLRKLRDLLFVACCNPRIIPSPNFLDDLAAATEEVIIVFDEDRKRQGQLIAPPVFLRHGLGPDGQPLPKSFELDSIGMVKMNREAMNLHVVHRADGSHGGFIKVDPAQMYVKQPENTNDGKKAVMTDGSGNLNNGNKPTSDKKSEYKPCKAPPFLLDLSNFIPATTGNTIEQVGYFDRFKQTLRRGFN